MSTFKKVMIIDDDELFLLVFKSIMKDEDFAEQIHEYEGGRDALEYLKSDEAALPEIIFLDINMPMMDGWEFMDALEQLRIEDKITIYITSSSINPLDLEKAENNPFIEGFISKPLDTDKLKMVAEGRV